MQYHFLATMRSAISAISYVRLTLSVFGHRSAITRGRSSGLGARVLQMFRPAGPPGPPPEPHDAARLRLDSHQQAAMRCIYRILREMLHAVFVIYGDEFVTAEERQASCATMTHFNALENFGDDIITRADGKRYIRSLLAGHVEPTLLADVAEGLALTIGANIGLGPFFTLRLDLDSFYEQQGALNRELLAGMFEATVGALHRKGYHVLLERLLQWCALLNMHCIQVGDVSVVMCLLTDGDAPALVTKAAHFGGGIFEMQQPLLDADVRCMSLARVGKGRLHNCLGSLGMASAAELPARPPVPVAPPSTEMVLEAGTLPARYQLLLVCHECSVTASTPLFSDATQPYEEAVRMGWLKPSTKNWKHSRCPRCAVEWR